MLHIPLYVQIYIITQHYIIIMLVYGPSHGIVRLKIRDIRIKPAKSCHDNDSYFRRFARVDYNLHVSTITCTCRVVITTSSTSINSRYWKGKSVVRLEPSSHDDLGLCGLENYVVFRDDQIMLFCGF